MKRVDKNKGLTLIEVMVVVIIIAVAVIGAMRFRYFGVANAKKADVQSNATRIGSMMLETWKGLGGIIDPKNPDMAVFENAINKYSPYFTFVSAAQRSVPANFAHVKTYQVIDLANGVYYFVTLSYKLAVTGSLPEPEALNALITWNQGYGTSGQPEHTISISTYVD